MPNIQSEPNFQPHHNTCELLNLPSELICPRYEGGSILNIPSSLCHIFGIPPFGANPLIDNIQTQIGSTYKRVVFILMDALALHRLQRWMMDGTAPVWKRLTDSGKLVPLTSIAPSTTSSALTTLWTGHSAMHHGIVGYEMWLKEYGMVVNSISQSPMSFRNDSGGLKRAGFDPQEFLNLPTLGSHLLQYGIRSYALQHASIINSGLSQMYFNDVERYAFTSSADLWVNTRELLENNLDGQTLAYVYWPTVDTLSHRYGPDDERTTAEFGNFSAAFESLFLKKLSHNTRDGTLIILTADHGCITTQPDSHYELRNHPKLANLLHIMPTGENRMFYLHVRPGEVNSVREYVQHTWPDQFIVINSTKAIDAGLFGTGVIHPDLNNRLGDLIVIARENAYLWWSKKKNFLLGRHGGLHPEEMLVPFLAATPG
jgi:predicted AlkP superfamily pyrophosphatase or phosphodiesterase